MKVRKPGGGRRKKLFIGTVKVGKYAGHQFAFLGLKSMSPFFNLSGISLVIHKKLLTHKGCSFRHAKPGEETKVYAELTEEIKEDIVRSLAQETIKKEPKEKVHIIGTVCAGNFAGTQFSFAQLKNAPSFFNAHNVSRVTRGVIKSYRGCTFRKASYEEAKPYFNNFTEAVADDLKMIFQPTTQIWAIPIRGRHKGTKFLLKDKKEIIQFFSPPSIYKIITGENKEHLGFSFALVRPEENREEEKNILTRKIFYEVQDELPVCFICTFKEWPLKGVQVGFVSRRMANRYFNMNSVRKVLNGKVNSYKKCLFRVATYEEASEIADNLTPNIADYLS